MGIPSYFRHITSNPDYKGVILGDDWWFKIRKSIFRLFIDANSSIYDALAYLATRGDFNEDDIIKETIARLDGIIADLLPMYQTIIAFDSIVPMAKMEQQRLRRTKTAYEDDYKNKFVATTAIAKFNDGANMQVPWDKNAITPNTDFMKKLDAAIISHYIDNSAVIVMPSGGASIGEGEHKIFNHIRNRPCPAEHIDVIYGLDADLIMLGLNSGNPDSIYLARYDEEKYTVMSIGELEKRIRMEMNGGSIKDYIFMCYLLGNDFLPHFPVLNIRTVGIPVLLNTYKLIHRSKTSYFFNTEADVPEINWRAVSRFVTLLAKNEHIQFCDLHKMREKSADNLNLRLSSGNIQNRNPRRPMANVTIDSAVPLLVRHSEAYINPFMEGWQDRYYEELFQFRDPATMDSQIIEATKNYLRGLLWVHTYYHGVCTDWLWHYGYNYAPLLCDLTRVLNNNTLTLKLNDAPPVSPYTQLAYVLPPKSHNLLPEAVRRAIEDIEYVTEHTFEMQWAYCRYLWEAHVEFKPIDVAKLNARLSKLQ